MARRSMVWLGVVACAVAAAIAVVWVTRPDLTRVPIDYVEVARDTDGRTLHVHLTFSSCQEFDRIGSVEGVRSVALAAYVHDLPSCGTAPTTSRVVPWRLELPLLGRPIVDTAGSPLTVAS
ncbi:hypothetical protein [Dactylosporangium sp. NPDC005555]|uniref:hypothetical protein n=1 Tax=Dactylosporangium sp. NPDC005555 TaxID=3154889 RepID=UPI0033A37F98